MMISPTIGIVGNLLTPFDNRSLDFEMTYTPHGFIKGVQAANALPIIFPISDPKSAKQYVERVDGIILTGGQDISPFSYEEEPFLKLDKTNIRRDEFELAIIKEAVAQEKPLLGICRGFQIYNVAMGGTLFQDVSLFDEEGTTIQHIQNSSPMSPVHSVLIDKESWLAQNYSEKARVNSYHHQAINQLGNSIQPVAWSKDGLIEAFERRLENNALHVGVQWHPEWMLDQDDLSKNLFKLFVGEVVKYCHENKES